MDLCTAVVECYIGAVCDRIQASIMWITLSVSRDRNGQSYFSTCEVDEDIQYDLPESITTPKLREFIAEKAGKTLQEIDGQASVKIPLKHSEFHEYIMAPLVQLKTRTSPSKADSSMDSCLLEMLHLQQQHAERQQQFMENLLTVIQAQQRQHKQVVKPDIFDGEDSNPETWIQFYELACEENSWNEPYERIKNMRQFLSGLAKKWYDIHYAGHMTDTWDEWRASFLAAFDENPVERWDRAIFYKYRSGKPLEYFYEKRRLLHMANAKLPESAVVPLIVHGLPKELQRQVQVKSPKTIEELLGSFRNICTDFAPQNVRRTDQTFERAPWRSRELESHHSKNRVVNLMSDTRNDTEQAASNSEEAEPKN